VNLLASALLAVSVPPIVAIAIVVIATAVVGSLGMRVSRTTSDFLVASRSVPPSLNALAICGEYLSAGTFLGLAGLVMVFGVDMLWYPVGYTAGYVALLILVAAPIRRFGAFTIAEFAQGRLDAPRLRRLSAMFTMLIGWLYLLPQMKGAGITLASVTGLPYWVGVVIVGVVVTANVAIGGMRGITYLQAFQYVVKAFALSFAAIVLLGVVSGRPGAPALGARPTFSEDRKITFSRDTMLNVRAPTSVRAKGVVDNARVNGAIVIPAGPVPIGDTTTISFTRGSPVPSIKNGSALMGDAWERPFKSVGTRRSHPLYLSLSIIVGTVLGTMGLPHILVRFHTSPDGPSTRRTILLVLGLLSFYYVWPPVLGVLGRRFTPDLLLTGGTDAVVILLPGRLVGGLGGELLTGLLAAGAFAAFLSTSSGLLISVAGAIGHDLRLGSGAGTGVRRFRQGALIAGAVAVLIGLPSQRFAINVLVGWTFTIAASTFCPLLLLGIWWRRFSAVGAAAGMIVGGGAASIAVLVTMFGPALGGWPGALLDQPAAWTVPLSFATAIAVSLRTPATVPRRVSASLARMHTPESGRPL
jgi:Na+(H+)/acetate symporter ActP